MRRNSFFFCNCIVNYRHSSTQLLFFLLTLSLVFFGCKKSSNSTPALATSQWTFDGKTYKVTDASYESSTNELFANDDPGAVGGGNFVRVFFWSAAKPTGSVSFTVVDYATSTPDPSTCSIQVGNVYGTNPTQYLSTGKAGDKVTLTVSSTGKLSTSFSGITVTDGTTVKTVSGSLIEQ